MRPPGAKPGLRLRFLSQYFHPEPGATSELLSGVAFELARRGHRVEAIAGQPSYAVASTLPRRILHEGVTIRRVWSTQMSRGSTLGRIVNALTFSVASLLAACLSSDARAPRDVLHVAVTNPPLLPWIALAARLLRRRRYCLLIHDLYPDVAVGVGALRSWSPVTWLWRKLNRWSYHGAERIVVLGRDMLRVVRDELPPGAAGKLAVIPNWADGRAIHPRPRDGHGLLESLGGRGRFVVQYSGNIGRFHEIETVLETADRLSEEPFLFVFFGAGGQADAVRCKVNAGAHNVRLLPFQPRERLGETLTACDVGLVTLKAGLTGLSVPSKLYGILAAGKPVVVIAPEGSEPALVVRERDCGRTVRPGDADGLVRTLRELNGNRGLCDRLGANARAAFEEAYDLPRVAGEWERVLHEALGASRRAETSVAGLTDNGTPTATVNETLGTSRAAGE